MMTTNEWLRKTLKFKNGYQLIRRRAICADGYSVSIQASQFHYCRPRVDRAKYYFTVELGFPRSEEESLKSYQDPVSDDQTQTVFGYVPIGIVDDILAKHGGIIN